MMGAKSAARLRMRLARLLESLERQHLATVMLLQGCLEEVKAAAVEDPLPPAREMIIQALQYAAPHGLSRSDILAAIRRDYGVEVSANTLTGTLSRMHAANLVRRVGQTWFIRAR